MDWVNAWLYWRLWLAISFTSMAPDTARTKFAHFITPNILECRADNPDFGAGKGWGGMI